ncbi:MAG: MFS transporter, partial [Dermabacter sp.]|nr:MFS transporter [Dermabacter sp.]
LTRRFGLIPVLSVTLALLAACLVTMALGAQRLALLVTAVVVAGLFLGILNTALTEAVMEATDLPRNIASSTYSGVRFLGGAIAPAVSGAIADALGAGGPYWFAAGAVVLSMIILVSGHGLLTRVTTPHATQQEEASAITAGDEV